MRLCRRLFVLATLLGLAAVSVHAAAGDPPSMPYPLALDAYGDAHIASVWDKLVHRARTAPFNLVATALFGLAIVHTFAAGYLRKWAHGAEERHTARVADAGARENGTGRQEVSFAATMLHLLGEVEAVFGVWCVPLLASLALAYGWEAVTAYVDRAVSFVEPLFVVVIMSIAATRPVVKTAETVLRVLANRFGGGTPGAWWFSILTFAPILGSFITEPAAMTIGALLLSRQFYALNPPTSLKYATLGLLFVNVSVGGVLTHFAAPPVLMVARAWDLTTPLMLGTFGYKAVIGIFAANLIYWLCFRKAFAELARSAERGPAAEAQGEFPVPLWVVAVHLGFLGWTVLNLHHPPLFIGGFLFFLAFTMATAHHQTVVEIRGPLLVGFFLAGLVVFGGMQSWWLQPVLASMGDIPLMLGSVVLTAFNDNAAITFLCAQVPEFLGATDLQTAVITGAVAGGGLTIIANAPNPAGQSILRGHFHNGISPLHLLLGALPPTCVMLIAFVVFPDIAL